ncbi:STAS domain-containing protein [Streptomyces sp. NPDC100445]|uniref:STAS domain-containing protein n=1 Tax=Streptomyces sp. NPDC100445 TaxID=3366102 RepID=UPI0037F7F154
MDPTAAYDRARPHRIQPGDHRPATWTVRVVGELDHDTSDDLVDTVVAHLRSHPRPRVVHPDFSGPTWIDSSGLSALLMIRRYTSSLGAGLCLDNRPAVLDHRLLLTDILGHLTRPVTPADDREAGADGDATRAGAT